MSDDVSLKLEERTIVGKQVKQLRRDGLVPAVIHDHGKPSVHVMAEYMAIHRAFIKAGKHHPVQLKAGDKSYTALIKSATFDPKKHQLTHVVFNAVDRNQKVDAEIPVRPRYDEGNESSPAERAGLIVLTQLDTIAVKAIATKLPDFLEYDAEKLVEVGDHVTVADLIIPEGVELEIEAEHALATVYEPSAVAAANDALAGDGEADASAVPSEAGSEDVASGNAAENMPGGHAQKEPKPSSVEATKGEA